MHLSMFSSSRMIPTRYMPLELECTLNTVVGDWLTTTNGHSTNFAIENIQLLYDAYALDEAIQDSFFIKRSWQVEYFPVPL